MCVSGVTCLVAFIICLLFAQNSGVYWVTLFDNFAGSVPLLTIGLCEMIAVVYIYGIDRFVKYRDNDFSKLFVYINTQQYASLKLHP